MSEAEDRVLVHPVLAADVPPDGLGVRLAATPDERAALAARYELVDLASLEAELVVRPWARTGFHVTGRVTADLTQTSVVSLEPVPGRIDEAVDLKLVPESEAHRYARRDEDDEDGDGEREDPPDLFDGHAFDAGAIAEEYFVLAIDPYPRRPGEVFDPAAFGLAETPEPDKESPFATLARLKRD